MRQVFYIDADEEMISVIGRLRRSPSRENVIVAPKRALILQSIINLRLLSHDARKNGKEIVVVTPDEQGQSLCEKAGIPTQSFLEEDESVSVVTQPYPVTPPPSQPHRQDPSRMVNARPSEDDGSMQGSRLPHSDSLGSSSFFSSETASHPQPTFSMPPQPSSPQTYGNTKQIAVRDNSPKRMTTLNSQRYEEEQMMKQQTSFTPPSLRGSQPVRPMFQSSPPPLQRSSEMHPPTRPIDGYSESKSPSRLQEYTPVSSSRVSLDRAPWHQASAATENGYPEKNSDKPKQNTPSAKTVVRQTVVSGGGKLRAFFFFFGFVSILSVAGVAAYLFLPSADITVKLKSVEDESDFEFYGSSKTDVVSAETKEVPVRVIEKDQEIALAFDATGKASLADQKARGSVVIYNEYSTDSQPLVASTRIISEDGKVFRLVSGVTVPGMTVDGGKSTPGIIEASVTADQSGQEYNLDPASFTIPGFQGSPKYAKFYAKSSRAFTGGGASGSDATAVSDQDVAKAKKEIDAKISGLVKEELERDVSEGERILDEAIETKVLSSSASPQSGAVTKSFEYRVKIRVRAFAFSENDLKTAVAESFQKKDEKKELTLSPENIALQYGEPTPDFSSGTITIKAHAVGRLETKLDEEKLKADLLGQGEDDLKGILQKYPQIDTLSLVLSPEYIANKIPTRADRVNIHVESSK